MRRFIIYVIFFIIFCFGGKLWAQDFSHSIGVKLGSPFGFTYQYYMNDAVALEAIATAWPFGPRGTLLYQRHHQMKHPRFSWYYGTGAHIQLYSLGEFGVEDKYALTTKQGLGFGIEAVVGFEYWIKNTPFSSDLNLKPNFEMTTFGEHVLNYDPSLTFRYHF